MASKKYIVSGAVAVVGSGAGQRYLYRGALVPDSLLTDEQAERLVRRNLLSELDPEVAAALAGAVGGNEETDGEGETVRPYPEGDPVEEWKGDEIRRFAAAQDPVIEIPSGVTTKAGAVEVITKALAERREQQGTGAQTPAA